MAVDIKRSHRRLFEEAWAKGNFAVFDEVCDRGYVCHDPFSGDTDLEKIQEVCRMFRAAFSDMKPTFLGSYAEGDTVVTQWRMTGTHGGTFTGIEPTGTRCTVDGISVAKFKGGKLIEEWTQWDALGLLRQLGVAPAMQPGAGARSAETRPHA